MKTFISHLLKEGSRTLLYPSKKKYFGNYSEIKANNKQIRRETLDMKN